MSDRLSVLEKNLRRLYEQLAGMENALILAPAGEKVRIRHQIEDLKQEIAEFEAELRNLSASMGSEGVSSLNAATLINQMTSQLVRQRPASTQDLLKVLSSKQSLPTPQRKTPWFGILALVGVGIFGTVFIISQNSSYQNPDVSVDPVSDYPKLTCGSGGTSYQVYVDDPSQLDYISSNFCRDAWVNGQQVQVALFGSEADAQNFTNFLAQQSISGVFYTVKDPGQYIPTQEEQSYKDANHGGDLEACIQDVMTWLNQEWTYDLAWNFCMTPLSQIQAE